MTPSDVFVTVTRKYLIVCGAPIFSSTLRGLNRPADLLDKLDSTTCNDINNYRRRSNKSYKREYK